MREALRCLKPAGMVIISDTPWYSREESGETDGSWNETHYFASTSVRRRIP